MRSAKMKQRLVKGLRLVRQNKVSVLLFILGGLILLFPIVSQVSYYIASHQTINRFEKRAAKLDNRVLDKRIALAKAYNETLSRSPLIIDPFTQRQKAGIREYARMLEVNEQIGHVALPHIGVDIPVYAGTSEAVLARGSGHLEGTSLPVGGQSTHAVLTAHRGLPTARLFTDLNKVKKGDTFYVTNIKETLAYKVDSIKVVKPTELEAVKIVEGKDYVTLLTCTPYMINSHRLLVRGERVPYPAKKAKSLEAAAKRQHVYQLILIGILILLLVVLLGLLLKHYMRVRRKGV